MAYGIHIQLQAFFWKMTWIPFSIKLFYWFQTKTVILLSLHFLCIAYELSQYLWLKLKQSLISWLRSKLRQQRKLPCNFSGCIIDPKSSRWHLKRSHQLPFSVIYSNYDSFLASIIAIICPFCFFFLLHDLPYQIAIAKVKVLCNYF